MIDCVSLFSGAGGMVQGAAKAGAKHVCFVDNDRDAAETLRINFSRNNNSVLEKDIQEVDFTEFGNLEKSIVIGGPPCQPFSKNGYWVKNENSRITEDPPNLLGQFVRAIKEINPAGFLFENVESITHLTNKPSLDGLLVSFEE